MFSKSFILRSLPPRAALSASRRGFFIAAPLFAGHSKWKKIKERKGVADVKKNAAITRAQREILTAVRLAGSADPEMNAALAAVLRRLKDIPKDNIKAALALAISKTGKSAGGENVVYEALALNTVGLIIECSTDNPTRTAAKIREILSTYNSRLTPVGFMFDRVGSVTVIIDKTDDELGLISLIDYATDNGAEDYSEQDAESEIQIQFTCRPETLGKLTSALENSSGLCRAVLGSELVFVPTGVDHWDVNEDEELVENLVDLQQELDENEDVRRVWSTWTPPEE
uniref:YebC-like protein n=1 Tax=Mycena chlorophos TaxID=658473 RepID=A0ABQ0MDD7_MYCCL|nr:predicted protein [Mycena chlorophos]